MRAADARLEHAAAPYGNTMGLRQIVDSQSFPKSAHAPELDVENPAGLEPDRLLRMVHRADAFVQADGRVELGLERRLVDDFVVRQRLLDHHKVQLVESLQPIGIAE